MLNLAKESITPQICVVLLKTQLIRPHDASARVDINFDYILEIEPKFWDGQSFMGGSRTMAYHMW